MCLGPCRFTEISVAQAVSESIPPNQRRIGDQLDRASSMARAYAGTCGQRNRDVRGAAGGYRAR